MSKLLLLLLLPVVALALFPIYVIYLRYIPPLPELDYDEWWGPGPRAKDDTSIRPFKVEFTEVMIKDLQDRIARRPPFTPPLENTGFEYGFNTVALEDWVEYWAHKYNFTERAAFLNQYPQYKTKIQGLDIHFIRVKPEVPEDVEVVPMLLLHGWPGSVREFYEAIPYLTAPSKDRNFALELIIPSLPGYGASSGAARPGMGPSQMGVVLRNLMHRLGLKKFYVQGGDWGGVVGAQITTYFPKEVLGFHTNFPIVKAYYIPLLELLGTIYPPLIVESQYADRIYPLTDKYAKLTEEMGHLHLQATKPDSVGLGLLDSPSGLLSYIVEKFSAWTSPEVRVRPDGGLGFRFTREQLLDNLMMYWNHKSIITAMRLYSEYFNKKHFSKRIDEIPTPVPTWALQAKYELSYTPPWMLKLKYPNLLGATPLDDGGHFLALQMPKLFSNNVLQAVKAFREWQKTNGYKLEL